MERKGTGRARAGGLELPGESGACFFQVSWTGLAGLVNSLTFHGILPYQTVLVHCSVTWYLLDQLCSAHGREGGEPPQGRKAGANFPSSWERSKLNSRQGSC